MGGSYADEDCDGGGPELDDGGGMAETGHLRGPLAGHVGVYDKNKTGRTAVLWIFKCDVCGRGHPKKIPPIIKIVCVFTGGNSMVMECVTYVMNTTRRRPPS